RFELAAGRHYYWLYEGFAGDPEKSEAATTGRFIPHSRSDYKFPRSLHTRNEATGCDVISRVGHVYTRRAHPTHPSSVGGWRAEGLHGRSTARDVAGGRDHGGLR